MNFKKMIEERNELVVQEYCKKNSCKKEDIDVKKILENHYKNQEKLYLEEERIKTKEENEKKRKLYAESVINAIPPLYKTASINDLEGEERAIAGHLYKNGGIIYSSQGGYGKTHLCFAIVRYSAEKGQKTLYMIAPKMMSIIKDNFSAEAKERKRFIESLEYSDILIIDEVDKIIGTKFELETLFNIVNERYNNMLITILVGNFDDMKSVSKALGQYVISRLLEKGYIYNMNKKNYRKSKK